MLTFQYVFGQSYVDFIRVLLLTYGVSLSSTMNSPMMFYPKMNSPTMYSQEESEDEKSNEGSNDAHVKSDETDVKRGWRSNKKNERYVLLINSTERVALSERRREFRTILSDSSSRMFYQSMRKKNHPVTLNRSPLGNKTHRDQFRLQAYKLRMVYEGMTPDQLIQRINVSYPQMPWHVKYALIMSLRTCTVYPYND
jgi:hypothetical protein